nr:hypothetical protein [uncultured Mediterranean phage uvMED]
MEINEILEKAKATIEVRENEIKQLEHQRQAYTIKQVKKKFPEAIFDNGELSEKTPKDIYYEALRYIGGIGILGINYRKPDLAVNEITDKIRKIRCEIDNAESSLDDASKITDAENKLKDKLFLRTKLLKKFKLLKGKINHIDYRIEDAEAKYFSCKEKLDNLKEFIG